MILVLAREGCCLNDDFVVLENPLSNELCILLDADIVGMYSLRLIALHQSPLQMVEVEVTGSILKGYVN